MLSFAFKAKQSCATSCFYIRLLCDVTLNARVQSRPRLFDTDVVADRACNGMEWNGMEDGMEEEFWYGIWKTSGMERNGRF